MATTIKLKNGSGAPTTGDLVQGEPAFDLTNKRLYTEDSGGSVIEIGTNPTSLTTGTFTSTGIDDNATSTAITIDSSQNITFASKAIVGYSRAAGTGGIVLYDDDQAENRLTLLTGGGTGINAVINQAGGSLNITDASLNAVATFNDGGNVGIGTASPARALDVSSGATGVAITTKGSGTGSYITFQDGTTTNDAQVRVGAVGDDLTLFGGGSERMRIDSAGRVMIGATSTTKNFLLENPSTASGEDVSFRIKTNGTGSSADAIFEMIASTTGECLINFGDENDANIGNIRYDHNINAMRFITNTNEAIRIDSSGNVGIGTASPNGKLDITGSGNTDIYLNTGNNSGDNNRVFFGDTADIDVGYLSYDHGTNTMSFGVNASERMRIDSSGAVILNQSAGSSDNTVLRITGGTAGYSTLHLADTDDANIGFVQYDHTNNALLFASNNAERMRIDSSGNVGIGTTSPASELNVYHATDPEIRLTIATHGDAGVLLGDADGLKIYGKGNGNQMRFYTGTTERMRIDSSGNLILKPSGKLYLESSSGFSPYLVEASNALTVNTNGSERMRIDSSGNVLVGTTSSSPTTKVNITQPANAIGAYIFASGATYTSSVLSVQGNLSSTNETYVLADFLNGAGTGRAKIYDSGDIDNTNNAYGALSDAKLKTEIIDASSQWDDIKALRFRKYKMIADPEQRVQMGVIAQEVEEAGMSGLVRETADKDLEGNDLGTTTKSVKYSVLYTKAIKALQEAMTRIETLEAEVAALKGE